MLFRQIYDHKLAQYAYLVGCQEKGEALIIDPERDIDQYTSIAAEDDLSIVAAAETHIHADFLSGTREFAERHGARLYLSDEGSEDWKYEWARRENYPVEWLTDGTVFEIGNVLIQAVHTPGHSPEHVSFLITDHGGGADEPMGLLTGDFVFVGDAGRPDLLESNADQGTILEPAARRLYRSFQWFLELPDYLQVWPGHGAGSACGKALGSVPETTVGYERRFSAAVEAVREGVDSFVDYISSGQPEPPLYFKRVKVLNREGVPRFSGLPRPEPLTADELADMASRTDIRLLDTRRDRAEFLRSHLPGAIYAPFTKSFPMIAGSYVEPEEAIALIIPEGRVEEAVRLLLRIGLDNVRAFATPETLARYAEQGGDLRTTELITFDELERRRKHDGIHVLDVRSSSEYQSGHVPGSQNIAHTRLSEHLDEVPGTQQLLVHCATGRRSSSAASLLEREGFDVRAVNDEWTHWARAYADQLVKEAGADRSNG